MKPRVIDPQTARTFLVGHAGLRAVTHPPGAEGVRALLTERRCIQLDPLDRIGTNAEMVVLARLDGVQRSDIYRFLYPPGGPGHAFEHFAKERCLLPASAFPWYRGQAVETPWWRTHERHAKVPAEVLDAVLAEIRTRGPLTPHDLTHHGAVEPVDWSGWKGTAKLGTMALELLWTRCQVVTAGRRGHTKLFDLPERALPQVAEKQCDPAEFHRWALLERVEAAGLLPLNAGPWWSMLTAARTGPLPASLVAEGHLECVQVAGASARYLAPRGFLDRIFPSDDGRMRILGPLDPLLWCRPLIAHIFGFDYVWEVYKPAEQRQYGWYVCPLLHAGELVGRFEARFEAGEVVVENLWKEPGKSFDDAAFQAACQRHGQALAAG